MLQRQRTRLLSALLIAVAVTTVVSCQAPSRQYVPQPPNGVAAPAEGMCRVYVARSRQFWGKIRSLEVVDGETRVGSIGSDGYLCWERGPGLAAIQVLYHGAVLDEGVVEGLLHFDGEAGGTYYYAVHLRQSDRKPEIKLLDALEGQALIAERSAADLR
jgi:hypothetical protein